MNDLLPIALINANDAPTSSPPLSLLCLSTILENNGYRTQIFDIALQPNLKKVLLESVNKKHFLWLGFTSMTPAIPAVKRIIEDIRNLDKNLPIMLGGIHASCLPKETLEELDISAVCIGDGDDVCLEFSKKVRFGEYDYWNIPGVASFELQINNKGFCKKKYRYLPELLSGRQTKPLPRPDWNKININDYQKVNIQFIRQKKIVAPVITAKGCPFSCSFCAVPEFSGRKIVSRTIKDVADEIEFLYREHGVEEFHIFDDIFNIKLSYAKNLLKEIIRRNLQIVWKAPVGFWILSYDEEFLDLLQESGCYQVGFGIESGSAEILQNVNKHTAGKLSQIPDILKKYQARNISTFGFFILGLPGETKNTIKQTIKYACSLPLDFIHVGLFTPYPGSKIFQKLIESRNYTNNWSEYFHYHNDDGLNACDIPTKRLRRFMLYFYIRFFIAPRRFWNLLVAIQKGGLWSFLRLLKKTVANM